MLRRPLLLAIITCVAHVTVARAEDAAPASAKPGEAQPQAVVELFTSQGCASCPPADKLLFERWSNDPRVLALTMAVDYWDYVGWKDTLALHGHGIRQKAYASLRDDRKVYTPQVVVNGTLAAKGNDPTAVENAIVQAHAARAPLSVPVKVRQEGNDLLVELDNATSAAAGAEIWACPLARRREVTISRGENNGRQITYANVVRGWVKVGAWGGDARTFRVPLDDLRRDGSDAAAILVQSGNFTKPGAILGATTVALH